CRHKYLGSIETLHFLFKHGANPDTYYPTTSKRLLNLMKFVTLGDKFTIESISQAVSFTWYSARKSICPSPVQG
ncbi:hypothetical protein CH063_00743, partial [Colletotrichum higginsianum]